MTKRIWFKPDCVEWIRKGLKTTTWRTQRHEGEYDIVKGSWFRAEKIGLQIRLTPLKQISMYKLISHYRTEGPFMCGNKFERWLEDNKLLVREDSRKRPSDIKKKGWLHKIEVLSNVA